jgi:ATP-binding cassette subfamily B protein
MSIGVPLTRLVQFIPSLPILGEKSKNILKFLEKTELKDENKFSSIENFDVEFSNVSFKYNEENSNYAVKNINFLAKENSITALVGESGSGKSTLTKLLIRFWDISEGTIKIGKGNIQDFSIDSLMDHISYVSQNNFLFNMSIRDNLLIGKPSATEDEIIKAITSANAKEFIDTLPAGLDTIAGLGGTKLSGGEMQRISIARAILKDTPIIILDEATSFTDPENEEKIQEGINKLIKGKTVFVIAHRLSTIVDADNIIVLKNGEISAQGTHKNLLEESKEYKKLWQVSKESKEWEIGGKSND